MDKNTENLIDKKIDGFALAMHKGFEEVGKRFESVEGEITSIKQDMDRRFEGVDERFESIDNRFDEMERQSQKRHNELMNSNDKMIKILQDNQQELASQRFISGKQQEKLENHEKRIKILELHKTA